MKKQHKGTSGWDVHSDDRQARPDGSQMDNAASALHGTSSICKNSTQSMKLSTETAKARQTHRVSVQSGRPSGTAVSDL